MEIYFFFAFLAMFGLSFWQMLEYKKLERLHRAENNRLHEIYSEERKALLDRIMANNIHEFKAATQAAPVKKSESGNFIVDRMTKSIKNQFPDFE